MPTKKAKKRLKPLSHKQADANYQAGRCLFFERCGGIPKSGKVLCEPCDKWLAGKGPYPY